MYAKFAIFAAISLSLVTVGYGSSIPDVCAVGKVPGSEDCNYTNFLKTEKTCCYRETFDEGATAQPPFLKPGQLTHVFCEDCKKDFKGEWVCGKPYRASGGSLPGDQQDSLDIKPTPPAEPKVPRGDILPDDGEPTINDPPTTTEPKILDPGKIEIPNLK